MGELHRMYDEVAPPSPEVLAEGRARLVALTGDDRRRSPRPRRSRGLPAVALAGAVAAAGAVVVAAQGSDDGPREIRPVSAHEVLTRAAATARLEPELHPRPGQYLYVRSVVAWGPGKVAPGKSAGKETRERWVSVDGSKPGLLREPCRRPGANVCDSPIPVQDESAPVPRPGSHLWLVRELPGLIEHWKPQVKAHTPAPSATPGRGRPFGEWDWYGVGELVGDYLPPRLRAEVFEFLSDVPRVRVDEHATDALGRPAVALSQDSGGGRLELMFDRSTYRFLGSRYLDLKPRPVGGDRTSEPESGAGEVKTTVLQVKVADRLPAGS
ncbi:CU044_5270 family protein [Actinomadura sp. NPDC000600]|uniref:CU044_5270 family protein n=1 Tax=Actinomadura sp. NPDC000600 TaxID=3154262 RepID=UPI0033983F56